MVAVERSSVDRADQIFDEASLVERVTVDGHLHAGFISHAQGGIEHRGAGTPILMALETGSPAAQLLP